MFTRCLVYLLMIMINNCSSSSVLIERLRRQKTIGFQSSLSSPSEFNVNEGSKFRLTCTFLSNFDKIDIYWIHNGTLIQSFLSKSIIDEEDDNVEYSFLAVTIISTIKIKKTHFDMNGLYQCIGVYKEIRSEQTFHVNVIPNKTNLISTNFFQDASITMHTYQSLFEPRRQTTLMCRIGDNQKDKCTIQWFDPEFESLNTYNNQTDLILKDPNFDDHMGLYACQICCQKQCQTLTSFVYPAGSDK